MAAEVVEAPTFGELAIPREYTITQQGREYILSDGLLVGLVQLSRGFYDLATEVVQLPTAENAQTAVCTAKVTVFEPETGRVLRTATGIGDASPANVGRMVAIHVLRMAETRAVARALRHLLGVGLTALEELGQGGAEPAADERTPAAAPKTRPEPSWGQPAPAAPRPVETIQVGGRTLSRSQVLDVYHARFTAAEQAGLQLAPMGTPGGPPSSDAPLPEIVDYCKELTRRLDARSGAVHANGAGGK